MYYTNSLYRPKKRMDKMDRKLTRKMIYSITGTILKKSKTIKTTIRHKNKTYKQCP